MQKHSLQTYSLSMKTAKQSNYSSSLVLQQNGTNAIWWVFILYHMAQSAMHARNS